jgi:MoCo/4Fe-4S cofactor protein with predicted Tat translocation signal
MNTSENSNFVPLDALTDNRGRKRYWRSLEELSGSLEFDEILHTEFPPDATEWPDEVSRRRFLQLAAASMGLAGMTACTRPPTEKLLPYVTPPANAEPGIPLYFASAVPVAGIAQGVIVESHLGRPTKIEGNPGHPASLGGASVLSQASVLDLYDPDRAKQIDHLGGWESWGDFLIELTRILPPIRARRGAGFHFLTDTITSPSLGGQMNDLLNQFPDAQWHQYDAAGAHSGRWGSQLAFGRIVNTYYRLQNASVILALDSDFLACDQTSSRLAHDYAHRRAGGERTDMNRLYTVETAMTATGGKADHRLPLRYFEVELFARDVAAAVGVPGIAASGTGIHADWIAALSRDLMAHRGECAIIPGHHQSPAVHALAHAINAALGNVGATVIYTDPLEIQPVDQIASLRSLVDAMDAGAVDLLLILDGNPVFNAPADFDFASRLRKVKTSIHVSLHDDETSVKCTWSIPESHFLEHWGDARAFDGTVTILQPLIYPLYDSRAHMELLDSVLRAPGRPSYDIVRSHWKTKAGAADFEQWWRKSVHDGIVEGSALPPIHPALKTNWAASLAPVQAQSAGNVSTQTEGQTATPVGNRTLEVVFRPDPYLYDGRFANNTWLQELPQPMTKLTWDNAVHLSPETAKRFGLVSHSRVQLEYGGKWVEGAVWVTPGQADDTMVLHLGWGHRHMGRAADGAGFDVYPLRRSDGLWFAPAATLRILDEKFPLATTQMQQTMEGRPLVLAEDVDYYKQNPKFAQQGSPSPPKELTLYPIWNYPGYAWGMSIDLTRCVNCNACVIACQAENNIPVVGKGQVLGHKAMHWLRVDVYYEGDWSNPQAHYQPVPCMQCEDAPCELVCPVQATNHSADGLNDMVYNRCVGTRYCSNNCPYKVRRFNFMLFQDWTTESIKLQRNPDVTVRSRGVMEKCTYCVQRIREAEIHAQVHDSYVVDGDLQTACQQACPTKAIIFGDINNKDNHVAKLKALNLNYALLAELNTRPRTTYLAELRNPNPELKSQKSNSTS